MDDIVEHFKKGTFEEKYWLPAHDKRRESALFKRNKTFIRDECGTPCWVCKSKKDLEVHHVFEWSFWRAMDPRKVTNILKAIEFYDEDYVNQTSDPEKLRAKIQQVERRNRIIRSPDDIRNLVVLCREHHRLKYTGVHTITFPIWLAVSGVPVGGGILTRDQIILAAERVRKLDEELASLAENNYISQTLEPVNLNTASVDKLEALPGIGETLANLIIANRPYATLEDLHLKVSGIGTGKMRDLKGFISV